MNINFLIVFVCLLLFTGNSIAHHVLGRPAYSLGDESNTPPSMQVETQIGDFYITYMAFPAFPKPGDSGRVNLYVKRIDTGATFYGEVKFTISDDSFFSSQRESLGTQNSDDGVYRQGFVIKEAGSFLITAEFEAGGQPYIIDFPLQIGEPFPIGPIGFSVLVFSLVMLLANLIGSKKLFRMKARQQQVDQDTNSDLI